MRFAPEIVSAMQQLAVEQRRLLGRRAPWHVGDLAWEARQHEGRENEWTIRLWIEDGRPVAWSWLKQGSGARLEHDVHPDHLHLLDEILAEPRARIASAFADDPAQRDALARHGFTEPGDALRYHALDLPAAPDVSRSPGDFRYRTADIADLHERVAIHRDVWGQPGRPSRVTDTSYAEVRVQWPYRESLDCVIEAPDGRFAAYCLCWLDAENGVGELEPVGVRPEFRRRGLGSAVCTLTLGRLHAEGRKQAIVYSVTDAARALYESIGLRVHASFVEYARP
jgi:ribosomal protein S18 acetylase RimI-like enzyme